MIKYVFDIDGTICTNTGGDYCNAIPYKERIFQINELYDNGNTIIIFTARGMGSTNNNQIAAINKHYSFTEKQLKDWGLKYHFLLFGKPAGDFYIDDKGVSDEYFFSKQ